MITLIILSASVVLQFIAGILALRLIYITGKNIAWLLLASALFIMAFRRFFPLCCILNGSQTYHDSLINQLAGLVISIFVVTGLLFIRPKLKQEKVIRTWSPENRLPLMVSGMFLIVALFMWLVEFIDIPHAVMGIPESAVNWQESLLETMLIGLLGIFVYSRMVKFIQTTHLNQKELRESEERFHSTLDKMIEGCQLIGFDWRYIYLNDSAARDGRSTKEALLGKTMMECYPGIEKTELFDKLRICMKERQTLRVENKFEYPDGSSSWFELSIQPVPEGIFILSLNITERKEAELEIKNLAKFPNENPNPVLRVTEEGILRYANPASKILLSQWAIRVGECVPNIWLDFVQETLKSKTIHEYEYAAGSFIYSFVFTPIAEYGYVNIYGYDITERNKLRTLRQKMVTELQIKNDELEQVLYATSHDLRSPLVNVQGFNRELDLAINELISVLSETPLPDEIQDKVKSILENEIPESIHYILLSTAKMDMLLKGLLRLSRVGLQKLKITPINMNALIANVMATLEILVKEKNIRIQVHELPACKGDGTLLNQVFTNVIENAIKYLDKERKGEIIISGWVEDKLVVYCVEDNGIGIEKNYLGVIFDMFHQLDPTQEGTGLGLTIMKRIVEKHQGSVSVESVIGKGSKFYIELPLL